MDIYLFQFPNIVTKGFLSFSLQISSQTVTKWHATMLTCASTCDCAQHTASLLRIKRAFGDEALALKLNTALIGNGYS